TLRPRQDRNDDLKPLEAREKRSYRSSTEKTDRSKVARSPNTIVFINTCDQIVCVSNVVRYSRNRLGQKKVSERTSARRITRRRGHRDGFCQVSVWSITDQTALGNPEDDFASPDEREEFQDELRERAFHA